MIQTSDFPEAEHTSSPAHHADFLLQAATGRNRSWPWYILTVALIGIAFVAGQLPVIAVVGNLINRGVIAQAQAAEFYETLDFEIIGISSAPGLLLLLGSFIAALIALWVAVRGIHGRRMGSLVSGRRIRWRKIAFAFSVWFVLTVLIEVVLYIAAPDIYQFQFDAAKWFPLMVVALLVLPLQTSFEELFIRGYLMQGIGLVMKRPWVAAILTSLLFAGMHGTNPEIAEFGLGVMMLYYFSVGAFMAILTLLDDGLEYALGIHAATNIYGAGIVSYAGSALKTDALFMASEVNAGLMVIAFYGAAIVFYLLARSVYGLRNWRSLFEKVLPAHTTAEDASAFGKSI
jgi:uncharacterized protein